MSAGGGSALLALEGTSRGAVSVWQEARLQVTGVMFELG